MKDASHDNLLDFLSIIQLTESVTTKIHGVFDQDEIFRILSDELKKSEKYKMMTLLLSNKGDEFKVNAITIPDTHVRIIETLIGKKVIGFTAGYKDLSCIHRAIESGETYSFPTMDIMKQLLPGKVSSVVGALTGHIQKTSTVSPIRIRDDIIGVFTIDTPELTAYENHFRLSVKNLTQHLSIALQLAEEHQARQKTELELKNDRDRFEKIVKTGPGVIYTFKLNPDGVMSFPFSTPSMFTLFGFKPEDLQKDASAFMQLIDPDDIEKVEQAIRDSAQSMTEFRVEYRYQHPQNGWIWVEEYSLPVASSDGSVTWTGFLSDVTERKEAEETITKAKLLLDDMGSMAKIGGWELNLATGKTFFTPETIKIHELPPTSASLFTEEAIGFYPPEAQPIIRQAVNDAIEKNVPYNLELPFITAKGKQIWVRTQGKAILKDGRAIRLSGAIQDITDRKLAEERLLESNAKRDAVLQTAMDGFIRIGLDGSILEVNESYCRKTGFTVEECLMMHVTDVDALLTAEQVAQQIQLIVDKGEVRFETKMRRKNGSSFDVELNARYQKENKHEFVVFVRDISEKKRAEAELRKLSTAMEQSPASVIITDLKGNINYVNPKFEEATGFVAAKVIGKNPRLLNSGHTSKEDYAELWKTITAGKTWSGVFHNKKRDGTLFWERASIGPIFNDKGVCRPKIS